MVKSEHQIESHTGQIKGGVKMEPIMCTRCVLTATTPGIVFDENGVCNYCHTYEPMQPQGEARLLEILDVECVFYELPKDVHRNATVRTLMAWGHHPSS